MTIRSSFAYIFLGLALCSGLAFLHAMVNSPRLPQARISIKELRVKGLWIGAKQQDTLRRLGKPIAQEESYGIKFLLFRDESFPAMKEGWNTYVGFDSKGRAVMIHGSTLHFKGVSLGSRAKCDEVLGLFSGSLVDPPTKDRIGGEVYGNRSGLTVFGG